MNTKELDSKYIANTYARFPIVLERGKGSLVWDSEGREYIDMGSGIAVNAFGLADGQWMGPPSLSSSAGCSTAPTSITPFRTPCSPSSCVSART